MLKIKNNNKKNKQARLTNALRKASNTLKLDTSMFKLNAPILTFNLIFF